MKQITITDGRTGKPIRETADGLKDPSGAAKDTAEREWETALLQYWNEQRERIKKRLESGIPKSRKAIEDLPKRLDANFWRNEDEELMAVLVPLFTAAATSGVTILAATVEAEFGIVVDWTLSNAEAVKWARKHAAELVKGVNKSTKETLRQVIAAWLDTPGSTMDDLFRQIGIIEEIPGKFVFSAARAKMIGVTEVTNSYQAGHEAGYEAAGFPATAFGPTAHPNGRCWTNADVLPNNEFVIVWRTNMDNLVCTRPLATPWGEVAGCAALENVIVSEGPWLGRSFRDAAREVRARERNA